MTLEPLPSYDGVRVLHASGELDVVSTRALVAQVAPAGPLVLDLAAVTFFDSAGVRFVDGLARQQAAAGHGFRVVAPPGGRARRVLDLVGMGGALVVDDLDAAVREVRD